MTPQAEDADSGRADLGWLGLLLCGAGALRAYAWSQTAVLFNDGPIFLAMADAIREGEWAAVLQHPYHPFYAVAIRVFESVGLAPESAAVGVSIFGGMLAIAALFVFLRDAFGRELAWLGAWTLALHPWAVDFSADVMSDGLYVGLYGCAFAALYRSLDRGSAGAAALSGVCAGLAYLTRPEGAALIGIGVLLLGLRAMRERATRARFARAAIVMGIAGGVAMAPYLIALEAEEGAFVLTRKKSLAALAGRTPEPAVWRDAQDSPGPEPETLSEGEGGRLFAPSRIVLPLPHAAVRADGPGPRRPPRTLAGALEAIGRVFRTTLAAWRYEVVAFALLGLSAARRRWRPWRELALIMPAALHSLVLLLLVWGAGYVSRRHALAPGIAWIGFAAWGWSSGFRWLLERAGVARASARTTRRVVCLALVVSLCIVWLPRDLRARRQDRAAVRAAAEWIAETHPDSGAVAAQKLRIAYYAEADFVPLPPAEGGNLPEALWRAGARWVVIDQAKMMDHQGLASAIGQGLRSAHRAEAEGRQALVLLVSQPPAR